MTFVSRKPMKEKIFCNKYVHEASSSITLADNKVYSSEAAEFFEYPNYGNDFADCFEDDIFSLFKSTMNDGTQAKEEGNKYFNDKNFIEAIKCYSKSIDESPTAAAYANRAMAYYELNKFNEVEKDCSEALKIDDKYFKAYARRAMAKTKLKCNLKGALEDVQFALKLEPNSQKMKELSAQLMCLGGNNKDGIQAKEEGNAYFNDKKFEEAIKCYTKSIEESPTAAAYGNRAISYIKLNKSIEAENDCTEAIKIDDKYFKAYARRAKARNNLGWNLKGAFDDVQVALKLDPNDLEMKELCHELSVQLKFQR